MEAYDFTQILELAKDDDTFVKAFVDQSALDLAAYLSSIKEGVEAKNIHWLHFIHHKSKTLFDMLNEQRVSRTIWSIYSMALQGQWEMESELDFLESEINGLIKQIKSELKTQEV